MKVGIHTGVPMAEYLAMPAVSASLLKTLLTRCPFVAWHESWLNPNRPADTHSDESDVGTVAHSILLEGNSDCVQIVEANDWRTNAAKEERAVARAAGKIPLLAKNWPPIDGMVNAARAFLESLKADEPAIWAAFQPDGGESELTLVWGDNGTLCKIRPDRISTDRRLIVDYKTGGTSAEPDLWGRTQMVRMGYYTSAAFYQRGIKVVCGDVPAYVWLVQEQEAPYLCSLVGLDPHAAALGADKVQVGLDRWKACQNAGKWPAYPTRVCYPEMPAFEDERWAEQQALEETE